MHGIDRNYSYTAKDFESLGESLKNKKISKPNLICKFKSKFDSSSAGDIIVFKFTLWKYPEVIDTCWGLIQYKENYREVKDYGIVCQ